MNDNAETQHFDAFGARPSQRAGKPAPGGKTYLYDTTVTIGDTNVMQNMYYANAFKLSGIVRELWIRDCVENFGETLADGTLLITKNAFCEYKKSFYLYDNVRVELQFSNLRAASVNLEFRFYKKGTRDLHMIAGQTVVFADRNHKISRIPANFLAAFRAYETAGGVQAEPELALG